MLSNRQSSSKEIGLKSIEITTGVMAKQANGSVVLRAGNTVLLATACMSSKPKEGIDFFPLTIEIAEKMYASGKIPGGFFKREARPSTDATLLARLIDRPLRPSFPGGFRNDVQIVITVLSFDPEHPVEGLAINAASAALSVSDIPFNGPVGGVTVGRVDGQFITNPSSSQLEESDLEITVSGTKDAILMIEAGAKEVSEEVILESIQFAHTHIKELVALQEDLASKGGKTKVEFIPEEPDTALVDSISNFLGDQIEQKFRSGGKKEKEEFMAQLQDSVVDEFVTEDESNKADVLKIYNKLKKEKIRGVIINEGIRPDGRAIDEVRDIEIEVDVLPNTHGSALFTRGETQSLGVCTLGTSTDEQIIDGLEDKDNSSYYFHYNFPPYSVGECGFLRTGRRELGHGALAERALQPVLPSHDDFPYTIRLVSEILESNGSSSMASVCSGSLALMDCGVPISNSVSGIAMGLLMDGDNYIVLSDIQGLEDHYGDMDFKVAGTPNGITALQLDIKIAGLSNQILTEALAQAKEGRSHIMTKMQDVLSSARNDLSQNAPRIVHINIDPEKVGALIGPGGKMIRSIEEQSGATVVVEDGSSGLVAIAAKSGDSMDSAKQLIHQLVKDIEKNDEFQGKVVRIVPFGAFVELVPGKDGLLHISTLSKRRINDVNDLLSVGDTVEVRVKDIDNQNRVSLEPVTLFD